MTPTAFNPHTDELVTRLMAMSHEDSRAWFAVIHDYLEQAHGVRSVHDFIRGCQDERVALVRNATLAIICRALREENVNLLLAPTASDGEPASPTSPPSVSP